MTEKSLFGVFVRLVGLVLMLFALQTLLVLCAAVGQPGAGPGGAFFMEFVGQLVLGVYMLRGAPYLIEFAYSTSGNSRPRIKPVGGSDPKADDLAQRLDNMAG